MKPMILILVQLILIHVPHCVNGEDNINLTEERALEAKLMKEVKKYNSNTAKTKAAYDSILTTATKLRDQLGRKLPILDKTETNQKTADQFLQNRLREIFNELYHHYINVLFILRLSGENNLTIKSVSNLYKEVDNVVTNLFFLSNADNLPRLIKMRQMEKRLVTALCSFNDIDYNKPNERLKWTPEILTTCSTLQRESEAGGDVLRDEAIKATDNVKANSLSNLVDLFNRLKNHYENISSAVGVINADNIWATVNQLETAKSVDRIYTSLALSLLEHNIKF